MPLPLPRYWGATPPPAPRLLQLLRRVALAVGCVLPLALLRLRIFTSLYDALLVATAALLVLLAARVAAGVHRWRLGHNELRELTHAARATLTTACSFLVQPAATHESHAQWIADLKRFLLAYVVLAVQDCAEEDPHDEMASGQLRVLLDDANELHELARLDRNRPRAAVVELWLRTRVSHAAFPSTEPGPPLLAHIVQTMELQRLVSTLPVLYENAVRVWSQPHEWTFLTSHTPQAVFAYLVLLAAVRAPDTSLWRVLVDVVVCGLMLFAFEMLATAVEDNHQIVYGGADDADPRSLVMRDTQEQLDAVACAFFRARGGLAHWERWNRSLPPGSHRTPRGSSIPRSSSSIAPASPRRSPLSGGLGSPGSDGSDGLGKPSLKHVLDMITTSGSPSVSTTSTTHVGTTAERQPLLRGSSVSPPRYDLFLRRDDERSRDDDSDATDVDEEDGDDHHENGYLRV